MGSQQTDVPSRLRLAKSRLAKSRSAMILESTSLAPGMFLTAAAVNPLGLLSTGAGNVSLDRTLATTALPLDAHQHFNASSPSSRTKIKQGIRELKNIYLALLPLSIVGQVVLVWLGRRQEKRKSARFADELGCKPCEFLTFLRPSPKARAEAGEFFSPAACPPKSKITLQPSYGISRAHIYASLFRVLPYSSIRFAASLALATSTLWCAVYMMTKKQFLEQSFFENEDAGKDIEPVNSLAPRANFWESSVESLATIDDLLRVMLAFFLMSLVRERMSWLDTVKGKIWRVKREVELFGCAVGVNIASDDAASQQAKCDIHRWVSAAHFFAYRTVSPLLQHHSCRQLAECGVLTADEVSRLGPDVRALSGQGGCWEESSKAGEDWNHGQESCDVNRNSRDLLLSWAMLRIRLAVDAGLMEKKMLKKILARWWAIRDAMEDFAMEVSRRPMHLWSVLMQVLVDAYVVLVPIDTLKEIRHSHPWLLPWAMLRSFVLAFFYDALLQLVALLWDPFGVHADSLHLDSVLLSAERANFARLGWSHSASLPEQLQSDWRDAARRKQKSKHADGDCDDDDDD